MVFTNTQNSLFHLWNDGRSEALETMGKPFLCGTTPTSPLCEMHRWGKFKVYFWPEKCPIGKERKKALTGWRIPDTTGSATFTIPRSSAMFTVTSSWFPHTCGYWHSYHSFFHAGTDKYEHFYSCTSDSASWHASVVGKGQSSHNGGLCAAAKATLTDPRASLLKRHFVLKCWGGGGEPLRPC